MVTRTVLGINMGVLRIWVVFLVVVVINLTFQYLIKTNRMKPSKASRLFYNDDERFIKSWKKTQEKGVLKYIIGNIIFCTAAMGIMGIVFILNKLSLYGYEGSQTLVVALSMGAVLGLITSLIGWGTNHDRYSRLKQKKGNNNNRHTP
jgi:amino acid transporter